MILLIIGLQPSVIFFIHIIQATNSIFHSGRIFDETCWLIEWFLVQGMIFITVDGNGSIWSWNIQLYSFTSSNSSLSRRNGSLKVMLSTEKRVSVQNDAYGELPHWDV
jgi:hypothetical protein